MKTFPHFAKWPLLFNTYFKKHLDATVNVFWEPIVFVPFDDIKTEIRNFFNLAFLLFALKPWLQKGYFN